MSFDFYEGPTTDSTSDPRITVRRGGLMVVLTQAVVEMLGEGVERVQIGYDPETRTSRIASNSTAKSR